MGELAKLPNIGKTLEQQLLMRELIPRTNCAV